MGSQNLTFLQLPLLFTSSLQQLKMVLSSIENVTSRLSLDDKENVGKVLVGKTSSDNGKSKTEMAKPEEPLLMENPRRFVILPILTGTSGRCTRRPRPASGRRRRSTCPRT